MCLEIIASIAPDAKGLISADRLSQLTGLSVSSRKISGMPSLHFAVTGGCSCEFLSMMLSLKVKHGRFRPLIYLRCLKLSWPCTRSARNSRLSPIGSMVIVRARQRKSPALRWQGSSPKTKLATMCSTLPTNIALDRDAPEATRPSI